MADKSGDSIGLAASARSKRFKNLIYSPGKRCCHFQAIKPIAFPVFKIAFYLSRRRRRRPLSSGCYHRRLKWAWSFDRSLSQTDQGPTKVEEEANPNLERSRMILVWWTSWPRKPFFFFLSLTKFAIKMRNESHVTAAAASQRRPI